MNKYQFVNVRFNLDKEEEKALFDNLNSNNRAGDIKKILKQHVNEDFFKKLEFKSIIEEIVERELSRIIEENKLESKSQVKININGMEHVL